MAEGEETQVVIRLEGTDLVAAAADEVKFLRKSRSVTTSFMFSTREHLEANGGRNWKLYLESRYKCTTCCVQSDEVGKHDSS